MRLSFLTKKKDSEELAEKLTVDKEQVPLNEGMEQMEINCENNDEVVDSQENMDVVSLSEANATQVSDTEITENPVTNHVQPHEEGVQLPVLLSPEERVQQIKDIIDIISEGLFGKDEAVGLALLSAIAGESIFFLGLPGTAKSMISRRITCAFRDIDQEKDYFEYLMNEFSTPDEICGPVSLAKLNQDEYVRKTEGYLPSAKVAFLDEIWKSGPAILNTLLTIINEKKFHNGKKVEKVPLISLAAASNELPERNRGLEALWDRFILRVIVNPVNNDDDFFNLIEGTDNFGEETDEKDRECLLTVDMVKSWQQEIFQVELPEEVKDVILAIRKELVLRNNELEDKEKEFESWYVSDRRWKKIVHLLKTSAFLNGRKAVDLMDCSLIEYCIWNTEKQHQEVGDIMEKILSQHGIGCSSTIRSLEYNLENFEKKVNKIWFDWIVEPDIPEEPGTDKIVNIEGQNYYECFDEDNATCYISVNATERYYDHHRVLNSFKKYLRDGNFSKKGDNITCCWNFTVKKNPGKAAIPGKKYWKAKLFEPVAKPVHLQAFTQKEYQPLLEKIQEELVRLQEYRKEHEAPFKANIFAKKEYSSVLLREIDEEIKAVEDIQLKLEKQKHRYIGDSTVKKDFQLGDVILVDGSVQPKEYKVKAGEQILATVCFIAGGIAYGLALFDCEKCSFEQALQYAKDFGVQKQLPVPYDSGWRLPTIEELQSMYGNKKSRNKKVLEIEGEFWSSSKDGENGVCYLDFDTGKSDHTTSDHPYGVLLIRKLALEE